MDCDRDPLKWEYWPDLVKALRPSRLTFAAEAVGLQADSVLVRATLLPLLNHVSAVVREGALYGIANHLDDAVLVVVRKLADDDPSPGVRQAAMDLLYEGGK